MFFFKEDLKKMKKILFLHIKDCIICMEHDALKLLSDGRKKLIISPNNFSFGVSPSLETFGLYLFCCCPVSIRRQGLLFIDILNKKQYI